MCTLGGRAGFEVTARGTFENKILESCVECCVLCPRDGWVGGSCLALIADPAPFWIQQSFCCARKPPTRLFKGTCGPQEGHVNFSFVRAQVRASELSWTDVPYSSFENMCTLGGRAGFEVTARGTFEKTKRPFPSSPPTPKKKRPKAHRKHTMHKQQKEGSNKQRKQKAGSRKQKKSKKKNRREGAQTKKGRGGKPKGKGTNQKGEGPKKRREGPNNKRAPPSKKRGRKKGPSLPKKASIFLKKRAPPNLALSFGAQCFYDFASRSSLELFWYVKSNLWLTHLRVCQKWSQSS